MATFEEILWKAEPVKELGFAVTDVKAACLKHHELFGSGPFFLVENQKYDKLVHYGEVFENVSVEFAVGAWGEYLVEFIRVIPPTPAYTYWKDHGPVVKNDMDHLHIYVDSVEDAMKVFEEHGYEFDAVGYVDGQLYFAFVDLFKELGFSLEFVPSVNKGFHQALRSAAIGWDKETKLFRSLGELFG